MNQRQQDYYCHGILPRRILSPLGPFAVVVVGQDEEHACYDERDDEQEIEARGEDAGWATDLATSVEEGDDGVQVNKDGGGALHETTISD